MTCSIWIVNFRQGKFSGGLDSDDFLIASQVASLFQIEQEAFFLKYPKVWHRHASSQELEQVRAFLQHEIESSKSIVASKALKDMFDSFPDPVTFLKATEILPQLRVVRDKFPFQEIRLQLNFEAIVAETIEAGVVDAASSVAASVIATSQAGIPQAPASLTNTPTKKVTTDGSVIFQAHTVKPAIHKRANAGAATSSAIQTPVQQQSFDSSVQALAPQDRIYLSILASQRDRVQELLQERLRQKSLSQGENVMRVQSRKPFRMEKKAPTTAITLNDKEKAQSQAQAHSPHDTLVPIRIDLDFDNFKFRDTFTWHLQERQITPEIFAEILCKDFNLPAQVVAPHIAKSIKDQLVDFSNYLKPSVPKEVSSLSELRILIKLNVTVGNVSLIDQFEWDINRYNESVDPEWFAEILTAELGLTGEFKTAIAHSIREQIYWHVKSLISSGYNFDPNNSYIDDADLQEAFLPSAWEPPFRDENTQDLFMPVITQLTEAEVEKLEQHRERDARQKRRLNRGRRVELWALRDPPKTARTLARKGQAISGLVKLETHNRTLSNSAAASAFRRRQQQTMQQHQQNSQPLLIPHSDVRTLLVAQPGTTSTNVALLKSSQRE